MTGNRHLLATRVAFLLTGIGYAAWAPLVPFVKNRNALSDGELGLLLLCVGIGSMISMPVAGNLANRFGCRPVLLTGLCGIGLMLPLLVMVTNIPLLGAALFVFGASIGATDCTMNIQAIIVERESGKAMMSGFHGLFSVGGFAGAAGMSGVLGLGIAPLPAATGFLVLLIAASLYVSDGFMKSGGEPSGGPAFAVPKGIVLLIGVLCFIAFLTEGAVLDWSGVFLTTERGVDAAMAGWGFAAFSITMTIGRFTGDAVVQRLGGTRVLVIGSLIAAAGMAVATFIPDWQAALLGYALVGLGCSNMVPVLFTAAGSQHDMPEHLGIPAVATLGYAGMLSGPALIGFIADLSSLATAFLVIIAMLLLVTVSSRWLKSS